MMARQDELFTLKRLAPRSDRSTLTVAGRSTESDLTVSAAFFGKRPIPDAEAMREILFSDGSGPSTSDEDCVFLMPRPREEPKCPGEGSDSPGAAAQSACTAGPPSPDALLDGWYHPMCAICQLKEATRSCYATAALGERLGRYFQVRDVEMIDWRKSG